METAVAVGNFSVNIEREYNASKQLVYDAFTQAEVLKQWFAPSPEMETIVHQLELEVGGHYKIEMLEPDGTQHVMYGEYVTLDPYDQLVFSWEWATDELEVNSLVTITLTENNSKTKLSLVHDRFESQHVADMHEEGWAGCIARLDEMYGA